MTDIELEPDSHAVRRFIERAVYENIDTPVEYAFDGTWPVVLLDTEIGEVYDAVHETVPHIQNPHGEKHKQLSEQYMTELLYQNQ